MNLTEIRNRTGRFLMMTFAFSGWSCPWRRWRWWRSHARGRANHNRRWRWWLPWSHRMWISHLILRWHQNRIPSNMHRLLWGSRTPSMQHPDGASYFRLQLCSPVPCRMSHFWALIPLPRVTAGSNKKPRNHSHMCHSALVELVSKLCFHLLFLTSSQGAAMHHKTLFGNNLNSY